MGVWEEFQRKSREHFARKDATKSESERIASSVRLNPFPNSIQRYVEPPEAGTGTPANKNQCTVCGKSVRDDFPKYGFEFAGRFEPFCQFCYHSNT